MVMYVRPAACCLASAVTLPNKRSKEREKLMPLDIMTVGSLIMSESSLGYRIALSIHCYSQCLPSNGKEEKLKDR